MANEISGILQSIEAGNKGQLKAKIDGKFYTAWPDSEGFNQLQEIKPGSPVRVAFTEKPNPNPQYGPYKNIVAIEETDEPLQATEEDVGEDTTVHKKVEGTAKTYTFGAKTAGTTTPAPARVDPSKFDKKAKDGYWQNKETIDGMKLEHEIQKSVYISRQACWNTAVETAKIMVTTEDLPDEKTLEGVFKRGNSADNLFDFIKDLAHRIEKDVKRQEA